MPQTGAGGRGDVASLLKAAREALGGQRFAEAVMHYATVLRTPGVPIDGQAEAHYGLGTARMELGELDAARTALEEALRLRGDYAPAMYTLAAVQRKRGDREAALSWCVKAAELGYAPAARLADLLRGEQRQAAAAPTPPRPPSPGFPPPASGAPPRAAAAPPPVAAAPLSGGFTGQVMSAQQTPDPGRYGKSTFSFRIRVEGQPEPVALELRGRRLTSAIHPGDTITVRSFSRRGAVVRANWVLNERTGRRVKGSNANLTGGQWAIVAVLGAGMLALFAFVLSQDSQPATTVRPPGDVRPRGDQDALTLDYLNRAHTACTPFVERAPGPAPGTDPEQFRAWALEVAGQRRGMMNAWAGVAVPDPIRGEVQSHFNGLQGALEAWLDVANTVGTAEHDAAVDRYNQVNDAASSQAEAFGLGNCSFAWARIG